MTNGIIKNGVLYKAVSSLNTGLVPVDNCGKCDLKAICEKSGCEYPCNLFEKKDHLVYFKKV